MPSDPAGRGGIACAASPGVSGAVAAPPWRRMEAAVAAGVLVFAVGFAVAAVWAGGAQTWRTLLAVPRAILPVMLGLSLVNYALRCWRWLLFSRALGLAVAPARNALYYVAGFAMTTTPGKLGEALRLWLLNRFCGCRYEDTAALLIADRLADAVAMTLVVAATVAWFSGYVWVALASLLVVGGLATVWLRPGLLLHALDYAYARLHRWPRLFVRARRALRALAHLAAPRVAGAALVLGVIGWCAEGLSFCVVLDALGAHLHPMAGVFVFAFGMVVGAITVLPGGLGSTEATMIGLLTVQHVPVDIAVVATAVVRVTTLWFAVSLGLLALPVALGGRKAVARA